MGKRLSPKILFLGWDAADWQMIRPLVQARQMPAMQWMMQHGAQGNLHTLAPIVSPLLWNSIATGKRADKHGILHFAEPNPEGTAVRPVSSTSRRVKALWNILTQSGLRTHVIGWFASHPAEPINGVCVSNLFDVQLGPRDQPQPVAQGTVHPKELGETLATMRIHPGDITTKQLGPFLPQLAEIDPRDRHLLALQIALAECSTTQRIVTWILQNQSWDFVAAYYNAIDHVGHQFMAYHPPRRDEVPEKDFERYQHVMTGIYRYHDFLLGQLLQLAGPQTTVILASDHGFLSGALRPRFVPSMPDNQPVDWHRSVGILAMVGPGIRKNATIGPATLLDLAPTALTLLGLPVGEDMEGRPLLEALAEPVTPERIPSWEQVPGESGQHPPGQEEGPWDAQAALQQLVNLGYLPALNPEDEKLLRMTRLQAKLNLAMVHLSVERFEEAALLLHELIREEPDQLEFRLFLARCRLGQKQFADARQLAESILQRSPQNAEALVILGKSAMLEHHLEEALIHFGRAEEIQPHVLDLQQQLASVYMQLQRWGDAEQAMHKALAVDPDSAREYVGLAQVCLIQQRYNEAAQRALHATRLEPRLPQAHFFLGIALAYLGRPAEAQQALEQCLALDPQSIEVHEQLAELHERVTGNRVRAAELRHRAAQLAQARTAPV
jgi:predicted AlkP superfamily phosphohydrolase/phosphomutase/tetratricopeptide (TPR) repeat protein